MKRPFRLIMTVALCLMLVLAGLGLSDPLLLTGDTLTVCLCLYLAGAEAEEADPQALTASLLPGHTLVASAREEDGTVLLFTANYGGAGRRLSVARGGELLCQSSLMPADTLADWDEDEGLLWLRLPSGTRCAAADYGGTWGIGAIELPDGTRVTLGAGHLGRGELGLEDLLWGSHPWQDIASVDWASFPVSWTEVSTQADPSGLGVVDSVESGLLTALRKRPDSASAEVGRYRRGAPFTVLSSSRGWVQVSIGGTEGWLPQEEAALGHVLRTVQPAYPRMKAWKEVPLYTAPNGVLCSATLAKDTLLLVMGEADGGWYHVLVPSTWTWGYVDRLACVSAD